MELVSGPMITTEDSYFVLDGSPYPSTGMETSRVVKAYVSTIAKKPTSVKSTDEGGGVLNIDTFQQCRHFNAYHIPETVMIESQLDELLFK